MLLFNVDQATLYGEYKTVSRDWIFLPFDFQSTAQYLECRRYVITVSLMS